MVRLERPMAAGGGQWWELGAYDWRVTDVKIGVGGVVYEWL